MACRDGRDCIKFVVYFLNACLFVLGIGIAGVAGYVAFNKSSALHNAIAAAHIAGTMTGLYIMFAGGLVIAVVAVLTCLATSAENRLLLWLTFFLTLMLLIMQLVGLILSFYKYKVIQSNLKELLKESVALSTKTGFSVAGVLRELIGKLESSKKCCGFNGPADYGIYVPISCRPPSKHRNPSPKGDSEVENNEAVEIRDESVDEERAAGGQAITPAKSASTSKTKTSSNTRKPSVTNKATASSSTHRSSIASTTTTTTTTTTKARRTTVSTTTTKPPPHTASATTQISSVESTAVVTKQRTNAATKANQTTTNRVTTKSVLLPPYRTGCFQHFKPAIMAAGGVGITVLIAEFLLLICIGLLLCEVGKEYDHLA